MVKLKIIQKSRIDEIKNFPNKSGLAFVKYGKSDNIKDYTIRDISEMVLGIYKDKKILLVDGDYFVDIKKVKATKCVLADVKYYKKPTSDDYKTNYRNRIDNIRTFYIEGYYLITDEEVNGTKEHNISRYLYKIGILKEGRNKYSGLYRIQNDNGNLLFEKHPQILFHPIEIYINKLFFNDGYRISDFIFESAIEIHTGN